MASSKLIPTLGLTIALAAGLVAVGCGSDTDGSSSADGSGRPGTTQTTDAAGSGGSDQGATAEQQYPDVVDVEVTESGGGFTVAATISSPYDSEERYADAFRVLSPDGTELTVRELTHDHADEQPFTRSSDSVTVPEGVTSVTVEARDLKNGWGGATVTADLPGR